MFFIRTITEQNIRSGSLNIYFRILAHVCCPVPVHLATMAAAFSGCDAAVKAPSRYRRVTVRRLQLHPAAPPWTAVERWGGPHRRKGGRRRGQSFGCYFGSDRVMQSLYSVGLQRTSVSLSTSLKYLMRNTYEVALNTFGKGRSCTQQTKKKNLKRGPRVRSSFPLISAGLLAVNFRLLWNA